MITLNAISSVGNIAYPGWHFKNPDLGMAPPKAWKSSINLLERLIQITQSNDQLVIELTRARRRIARSLEYANDPNSGPSLTAALMAFARKKEAQVLDQVRANRFEALEILAWAATGC